MPDEETVDWRAAARNAGYTLVPTGDYEAMTRSVDTLKGIRAHIPEDQRGQEVGYIKSAVSAVGRVKELETSGGEETTRLKGEVTTKDGELKTLREEKTTWETEKTGLQKDLKMSHLWGHVGAVQRSRNVVIHEKFIDEEKLVAFPLDKHDTSTEEGVKKFTEAVWKDVLEPAFNAQAEVIRQVAPGAQSQQQDKDGKGGEKSKSGDENEDDAGAGIAFGSQA